MQTGPFPNLYPLRLPILDKVELRLLKTLKTSREMITKGKKRRTTQNVETAKDRQLQ